MKVTKAGLFLVLLFLLTGVWPYPATSPRVNLYLIKFDNLKNEESLNWLSSAFPDMLQEYFKGNKQVATRNNEDLEAIMSNRNLLLHQPRGTKNFLVLGKFERQLDEILIHIQLINIANWEEVGSRKIAGKYTAIPDLNKQITENIESMIQPFIPKVTAQKYPEFSKPEPYQPKRDFSEASQDLTSSIDEAIDELEYSMDLASGARGKPDEHDPAAEGEWVMDLNVDNEIEVNPENAANTEMLETVVRTLTDRPYNVTMKRPQFEYDREDDSKMDVIFPVTYSLKENIIKDMLVSLPYSGLQQDGSLTIFYFNRDKFNFPDRLINHIQKQQYRSVPVIQFTDKNGQPRVVIVDSPDTGVMKRESDKVKYIPVHRFSPLIDFTLGGWSLQIAMETVEIPVEYRFSLDVKEVDGLERVKLKFIPETELNDFLDNIL